MSTFRIADAARLLGVSDDTARRWAESGRFALTTDETGHLAVDGAELARFATTLSETVEPGQVAQASARNRLVGIVTKVIRDTVMAQVEMQCGGQRIVSLISREAADELELEPGVLAVASIKATNVVVELPAPHTPGRRTAGVPAHASETS
jgi:molybdopterin-binding protein